MHLAKWIRKIYQRKQKLLQEDKSGKFTNELHQYLNIHKNQRCFVVGNGPSLNKIDMSLLKNEITLGSNRVYLGFKKWGYHFTYWGIEDVLQIKQGYKEFSKKLPDAMRKFVPQQYCHLFKVKNLCPVNFLHNYEDYPLFSNKPEVLYTGWTVTYMLLQIAVIMGCNPIYLVGVDYDYKIPEKMKVGSRWSDPESASHFIPNYCGAREGRVWGLPNFSKTDASYKCAANWAKAKGIRILNAAPGSKLTFFERVGFKELF